MTITVHFQKDLPNHLAIGFVSSMLGMMEDTCQVHVHVNPASRDNLSLTNVSGRVVCNTMWEVPLGTIFDAFDVETDRG